MYTKEWLKIEKEVKKLKKRYVNNLILLIIALIWGAAFVAQSAGMDYIGPFTFNSARSILGGIVLIPVIYVLDKKRKEEIHHKEKKLIQNKKTLIDRWYLLWHFSLCWEVLLQQIGIQYTTAGKAGFITALYILIVPILGMVVGKKAGIKVWIGVVLAVIGMYFLCMTSGFSIAKGDFYILLGSVAFSFHILGDRSFFTKSRRSEDVLYSVFCLWNPMLMIPTILFEHPEIYSILQAWKPIAYAGIMSCGVGYTLQIVAQKNTDPTVASLLLSLESVFSVLAGWVILGETLSPRELFGCALVFAAVILAQLPERRPNLSCKDLQREESRPHHSTL